MAGLKAPYPPPRWTHTPELLTKEVQALIDQDKEISDRIAALPAKDCNFTSVFLALAKSEATFSSVSEPLSFYQNVSPQKPLRDASNDADVVISAYGVENSMRKDLFDAKVAAKENMDRTGEYDKLDGEQKRLVDKMLQEGRRAGLALPEKERQQLSDLKKELSAVCLEFSKNFNEEDGVVTFTLSELEGVPADVVSGYTKRTTETGDVYDVPFKTTDIFPVLKYAIDPTTRRRAHEAYEARLAVNAPLLAKALDIRRQIAALLGYPTWADYVTEEKMVGNAANAMAFLEDLERKLRPVGEADRAALLELKKEEHARRGLPFDGELYIWDYRYYDRLFVERTLALDDAEVKEYFEVERVVPTILEVYQRLLGVRFVEIQDGNEMWHKDVQGFEVWNADAKDASGFVGYCYLDLFPRPSKYGHAAVWGMLLSAENERGESVPIPLTCMVANLAKPTPDRPALMRHDDVVTFFHEMGHVFHGLLSKTKYARFHGTSVARDFVEAPSQMLENWCWEPKVLKQMSRHYKTGEPLSDELIKKIVDSRYVNVGLFYLRQLFFAKFDMKVHMDSEPNDYTQLWNSMREQISLVKGGEPQPGQGTFGHITGGYDAGYYGYTYSLVFAADMYKTVFEADPLDPKRGQHYRESILLPGGSRDEMQSLEAFLGRKPNSEAFLEALFGSGKTGGSAAVSNANL
ncbi:metallopeptidase MepB [Punctularia strigosozonata HHB-11173 SS5]|uniref:metallopeptidase MepB n=1 Tax=Punctularia strigosozonata (strain HHB-11173) TaxID=741275 RepID=UPI0004417218|nr:metallopeptidase MepB [Punctularia strigosozonata HHB-11173 SS5]EIN12760.1 metallopeptidase MepB [Punctularia strigosozonata HHB-11173 SS5]